MPVRITTPSPKALEKKIANAIKKEAIPITCPHCNAKIKAAPGVFLCPACGEEIDLKITFQDK